MVAKNSPKLLNACVPESPTQGTSSARHCAVSSSPCHLTLEELQAAKQAGEEFGQGEEGNEGGLPFCGWAVYLRVRLMCGLY